MMERTHGLVSGTSAFVATTAVGAPLVVVAASVVGATATKSWPDRAEKILHCQHRRLTHRPFVQICFFAAWGLLAVHYLPQFAVLIAVVASSMAFGCVMHSVADGMTVERNGIEFLWPISRRGYHLLPRFMRVWVGSKSRSERTFVAIWTGFVLIYAYAQFGSLIFA